MKTKMTMVLNLETGEELYFDALPVEALISASILKYEDPSLVSNPLTRKRYAQKVLYGVCTASIGVFGVQV
jgi:hypothetical protein